eukprot:Phypoly_transcript_11716.p1 GENE.Phypoly_transcript_11716~~Phypoly_transcript_11716.p1  ORF type:complete len:320 (+),score=26.23 Phypoly_transcript_11716:81-1040(+)
MAGSNDKILLTIRAIDDLYLPGPASYLFRCSKGLAKTYSIKPTTQFKFLFSSFCVSQGLDIQALDFLFITHTTPLCEKSNPQQHLMVSGDIIMVMMKKIYYLPQLPPSTLATQMKFLVNNPSNSDIIFSVAGEKLYAHKAILSARCEKFRSMFQNNMIESGQNEINLQIEDSGVLLALLEYLYTDNVENFTCDLAFELMILADEYLLSRLRQICECQLQTFVNTENACSMLAYAHNHNANDLKQFCMNFVMKHFDAISPTKGYQDLKTEPDLLLEISRMLPKHLAQPINLAKKLAPKNSWSSLVLLLVPAVFVFVAGVV